MNKRWLGGLYVTNFKEVGFQRSWLGVSSLDKYFSLQSQIHEKKKETDNVDNKSH